MSSNQSVVTSGNFAPLVNVVNWFTTIATALFVITRIITKLIRSLKIGSDDTLIILSTISSFAVVAAVTIQTSNGLGKHESTLSTSELEAYQKSEYSGDIFYILSLALSKLSVLLLLQHITPVKAHIRLIHVLGGLIVVWGTTSFFVAVFQCKAPDVWQLLGDKCIDETSFWTYFGISNIILEIAMMVLPAFIIQGVHIAGSAKGLIMICFATRLLVIGGIIPELLFRRRTIHSTDITYDSWHIVVSSLFVQCLSIITACIPYLKPFFTSLESGMLRTDDQRRREGTNSYASKTAKIGGSVRGRTAWSLTKKSRQSSDSKTRTQELSSWQQGQRGISGLGSGTLTEAVRGKRERKEIDEESQTSRSRFIQQTMTWEVSS